MKYSSTYRTIFEDQWVGLGYVITDINKEYDKDVIKELRLDRPHHQIPRAVLRNYVIAPLGNNSTRNTRQFLHTSFPIIFNAVKFARLV